VHLRTMAIGGLFLAVAAVLAGCASRAGRTAGGERRPIVTIQTSQGTITAELWPDKAPITVENFLRYVDEKHYDQTIFHRCIRGFMIQGGGFTPGFQKKAARGPIRNEADNGVRNLRGTLAMARTGAVNSATAEFFINTEDNRILDHEVRDFGYAVFGQVTEGMDVVHKIERAPVVGDPREGRPEKPVVIQSIRRAGAQ